VLKRSMDFTLAGVLLAFTLPLMIIAAVFIQLETGESPFFCQRRMGRGFKTFKLWKLRTMRSCFAGPPFTLGADPRITRVGRWLRWSKIVGSRPVIPELAEEFEADYVRLLAARPGLTDPATVKYCRETELMALVPDPLDYFKNVIMPDKLRISLAYLDRASVRRDVGVLLGTAIALVPSAAPLVTGKVARTQKLMTAAEADSMREGVGRYI